MVAQRCNLAGFGGVVDFRDRCERLLHLGVQDSVNSADRRAGGTIVLAEFEQPLVREVREVRSGGWGGRGG